MKWTWFRKKDNKTCRDAEKLLRYALPSVFSRMIPTNRYDEELPDPCDVADGIYFCRSPSVEERLQRAEERIRMLLSYLDVEERETRATKRYVKVKHTKKGNGK